MTSEEKVEFLMAALERIGSMEAFTLSRAVDPRNPADIELSARIDFARETLAKVTMDIDSIKEAVEQYRDYAESDEVHEDRMGKYEHYIMEQAVQVFDPTLWDLINEKLE